MIVQSLQSLLELVTTEMTAQHCQADEGLLTFFKNTIAHIKIQQQKDDSGSVKFRALKC